MVEQHECKKEREIDDLKKEIENIKSLQFSDHDILIRIETKFDAMSPVLASLENEIRTNALQPQKQFEKLKHSVYVAVAVTFFTVGVPYLINLWLASMRG